MSVMSVVEAAKLVRETRQRLGLTQAQLAEELGVSCQSVNRWENGRNMPLPIALKQIEILLRLEKNALDLLEKHFPNSY